MPISSWTYSASNEANLMKVKYGKLIEKQFAQDNVLFARINQKQDFVGSQIERPIIQSIGGGVGAGSLPTANESKVAKAVITSKKLYAVTSIDRETKAAAKKDEGSFVRMTAFPVKQTTKAFNRNLERMITRKSADGTAGNGALIKGNASNSVVSRTGSSGSYVYTISFDAASTYFPADFQSIEIGDIVNLDSESVALEVTDMTETVSGGYSTGTIVLTELGVASSGLNSLNGAAFGASNYLYMQGSKGNEILSIGDVIAATSGSLYSVTVGRRWQAYQKNAASASISTDLLNDVVVNMKRQCGESPSMILMGHHQYIKFLNLLEDQKSYNLPAKGKFKGQVSFSGIEFLSADGVIPVMMSRFIDSDKVYFLNDKHIEMCLRPGGFEWFDDDGTVFLRESTDSYEARYGGYGQLFVNPHFQGYLHSLAV